MRRYLLFLFLLNQYTVLAQDKESQFGIALSSRVIFYDDWNMGLDVSYTNQRHLVSFGIKFAEPGNLELGYYGVGLNYRVYPNLPKKVFNLFFQAGFDFKRINNSYMGYSKPNGNPALPSVTTEWRDEEITMGVNLGYGFDVNLTKNFYFNTSLNVSYIRRRTDHRIIVESNPVNVIDEIHKQSGFIPIIVAGFGYNFTLKKNR